MLGISETDARLSRAFRLTSRCRGFRGNDWSIIYPSVDAFLAERVDDVYGMGWRGLDLFGAHAVTGRANVSACGALLITMTVPAETITPKFIRFGRMHYAKVAMQPFVLDKRSHVQRRGADADAWRGAR